MNVRRDLVLGLASLLLVAAATLSLDRTFIAHTWLPATWSALGLAGALAGVARRLRLGVLAAVVLSAVFWVVHTYVVHLGPGGLLPGVEQIREFVELWSQGMSDMIVEPAPARPLPGLLLMTSAGVWWITHLVHEVVVRGRRPGFGILAAATLWAFPLAVPQPAGRTWPQALPFLAAAGMLLLVDPDPDLASWRRGSGRALVPGPTGLVLGALALLVALTIPAVVPGYGAEAWVDVTGAEAARGYQPIVDVSRRLKLPAERDLLRVTSEEPLYLRLAGLDTFDGNTWRLGPADQASFEPDEVIPADRTLPPEVPIAASRPIHIEIENLSLENVFVPVPYRPVQITGAAARRMVYSADGTFIASSETLDGEPALVPGLSYGVDAELPAPTTTDLSAIGFDAYADPGYGRWTQLPGDYPTLAEEARRIVEEAGATTPYEVAFTLQDHFRDRERYRYSIDVPALRGADALADFVTTSRTGYCEYFATAMAAMLRLQGIPSRVAVGFRVGDRTDRGDWLVTTHDAHAWVEVLFPGHGWIQFEPTPALSDAIVPTRDDVTPSVPVGLAPGAGSTPQGPTGDPTDVPEGQAAQNPGGLDTDATQDGSATDDGRTGLLAGVAGLLIALVAAGLAMTSVARRRTRHHPELDDPERVLATQRRVLHTARTFGIGRREHETALEVSRRWADDGRVDPGTAERLARLSQAAAFGGALGSGSGAEAERLGDTVVDGLRTSVPRSARAAAPVRIPYESAVGVGRRVVSAVRDTPRD